MATEPAPDPIGSLDRARLRYDCLVQALTFSKPSPTANPAADSVGIRPPRSGLTVPEALAIGDQLVEWCLKQ